MNFDHWKDVLNESAATPLPPKPSLRKRSAGPDFFRAYVNSATDPGARKRAARAGGALIPKAPGYSAVPSVATPMAAFIAPQGIAPVRAHAQEELV